MLGAKILLNTSGDLNELPNRNDNNSTDAFAEKLEAPSHISAAESEPQHQQ